MKIYWTANLIFLKIFILLVNIHECFIIQKINNKAHHLDFNGPELPFCLLYLLSVTLGMFIFQTLVSLPVKCVCMLHVCLCV